MKTINVRLMTTHLDAHNERLALSALKDGKRSASEYYLPVLFEHDPRIPPIGRIIDAEIVEMDDGEYALDATYELFDGDGPVPYKHDRRMRTKDLSKGELLLSFDRNMTNEQDQDSIKVLADALGVEPLFEGKKALDPISVLTIGGAFVAGGIASGFLKSLGADLYEVAKERVKEIMSRRKEGERDKLFKFHSTVLIDGRSVDVEVIITNPSPSDIDAFFDSGISEVDHLIFRYLKDPSVARIVLDYQDQTLQVKFGVREDCAPLYWRTDSGDT